MGYRDREAGIRICPTFGAAPEAVAKQFNFEFRAGDATANPYLQLAMIMRVGLSGIRDALPAPQPTIEEDPETMSAADRTARGIVRLPASADQALAALDADPVVQGFLPERLLQAYIVNKKAEFAHCRDWNPEELCQRYAEIY